MNVGASTLLMWMPQLRSGHMRTIGNILVPSVWQHVYYGASCNFYDYSKCRLQMGSVIKKRRKRMSKKKHRKLLRKTRHQRK